MNLKSKSLYIIIGIMVLGLVITGCSNDSPSLPSSDDTVVNKDVTVSSVSEFNTALQNDQVGKITLANNITGNVDTGTEGRVKKLDIIDLNDKTIDGSLYIEVTGEETGTLTIKSGNITKDLTVDTANLTVENNATIDGTTNIVNVSTNTFKNNDSINNVVITDGDGSSFENSKSGKVNKNFQIKPTGSGVVNIRGSLETNSINIESEKAKVKIDKDTKVNNVTVKANEVEVVNEGETNSIKVDSYAGNSKVVNNGRTKSIELSNGSQNTLLKNSGTIDAINNNSGSNEATLIDEGGEVTEGQETVKTVTSKDYEGMKSEAENLTTKLETIILDDNSSYNDLADVFDFTESKLQSFYTNRSSCSVFKISDLTVQKIHTDLNNKITGGVIKGEYYQEKSSGEYIEADLELVLNKTSDDYIISQFGLSNITEGGQEQTGPTVTTAQKFVSELNNSGIHMKNTINRKLDNVKAHLVEDISPEINAFGTKVELTTEIINIILTRANQGTMLAPGTYTINMEYNYENYYWLPVIETGKIQSDYDDPTVPWSWDITINYPEENYFKVSSSKVSLTTDNLNNALRYNENNDIVGIDLSELKYNYEEETLRSDGSKYIVNSNFDLTSSVTNTYVDDTGFEWINPWVGNMNMDGTIIEDGTETVISDSTVEFDFDDNATDDYLKFTGNFTTQNIQVNNAKMNIQFYDLDQNLNTTDYIKNVKIKSINFSGEIVTDLAELSLYNLTFAYNENKSPTSIDFNGEFLQTGYTSDNPEFLLNGDLNITFTNPENYDPNSPVSTNNYITGTMDFYGQYKEAGFRDIRLDAFIEKTGYKTSNTTLTCTSDGATIVDGNFDYKDNGEIVIRLINKRDSLLVDISTNDSKFGPEIINEEKIGYVYDNTVSTPDTDDILGEIYVRDGQIQVDFKDGTTKSLLM